MANFDADAIIMALDTALIALNNLEVKGYASCNNLVKAATNIDTATKAIKSFVKDVRKEQEEPKNDPT